MGHARSYLSLDILRRVFRDYFGYDVEFIMNITDVDDKIIKRARQRHLLKSYFDESQAPPVVKVIEDVVAALEHFKSKFENEVDQDKKKMLEVMVSKVFTMYTVNTQISDQESSESVRRSSKRYASSRSDCHRKCEGTTSERISRCSL